MSTVREYAFNAMNAFDVLAQSHIQTAWTNKIWNALKWYVTNRVFPKKTDVELRKDLQVIYDALKPLFEQVQTANMIQEGERLGSPKIPRITDIKKVLSLVDELK